MVLCTPMVGKEFVLRERAGLAGAFLADPFPSSLASLVWTWNLIKKSSTKAHRQIQWVYRRSLQVSQTIQHLRC